MPQETVTCYYFGIYWICLTTIDIRNSTVYFNKVSMMTATMPAKNIYLSRAELCFCGDCVEQSSVFCVFLFISVSLEMPLPS